MIFFLIPICLIGIIVHRIKNKTFRGQSVGLQNAPVSLLSLRYILPKVATYPAPDIIVARDNPSLSRLSQFWSDHSEVILGSNYRETIDLTENNRNRDAKSIFIPLSIGFNETKSLLAFLRSENGLQGYDILICVHPLLSSKLKKKVKDLVNAFDNVNHCSYQHGIKQSKYVMSTTSTALVEGLNNGLVPLQFTNDSFVSASPLDKFPEFENKVSFSSYSELNRILKSLDIKELRHVRHV